MLRKIVTILTIAAMAWCLTQAVEFLQAANSTTEKAGALSGGGYYHFPGLVEAPAMIKQTDDNRFSPLRIDSSRFFALLGFYGEEDTCCFLKLGPGSKCGPVDNKDTILLKLRI